MLEPDLSKKGHERDGHWVTDLPPTIMGEPSPGPLDRAGPNVANSRKHRRSACITGLFPSWPPASSTGSRSGPQVPRNDSTTHVGRLPIRRKRVPRPPAGPGCRGVVPEHLSCPHCRRVPVKPDRPPSTSLPCGCLFFFPWTNEATPGDPMKASSPAAGGPGSSRKRARVLTPRPGANAGDFQSAKCHDGSPSSCFQIPHLWTKLKEGRLQPALSNSFRVAKLNSRPGNPAGSSQRGKSGERGCGAPWASGPVHRRLAHEVFHPRPGRSRFLSGPGAGPGPGDRRDGR